MSRNTFLLFIITLSYFQIFAQEAMPGLFIGIYDKEKKGICSDKDWIHEEVKDHAEYEQKRLQFREVHKNDESFSTSVKFVSDNQCVIVYEYRRKTSGFSCTPVIISYITCTTIEVCKAELAAMVAKNPTHFVTQPRIIFSREASPKKPAVKKPDETKPGGGSGSEEDRGNNTGNNNTKYPTYGFKFHHTPGYNCVALEWWSLSQKTNSVDAGGNFRQSSDPEAKYFTIEYRKQGDIYWTSDKRENTGRNVHSLTGLDACTKYEARLITTCDNNIVSAPTNIARFTTACLKPGNLSVENITVNSAHVGSQRITALFSSPCSSSATTQIRIFEYKSNTTPWQHVICNSGSPCFLNALSPGTIYRVRARFKYGNNLYSNYTNEISFTTK